jgi:hypothetical protein
MLEFVRWDVGDATDQARGLGLGLVAQIIFRSGSGSGLVQMILIKHKIEHFGLSRAILFSKIKSYL